MGELSKFFLGDEQAFEQVKKTSALDDIFEEEPVDLTTFVQDAKFLKNPPLSDVQYNAVRHIERIYPQSLYPQMALGWDSEYWAQPCKMCNFITLMWGKGCITDKTDIYNAKNGRWSSISSFDSSVTVQGVDSVNLDGSTEHLADSPALVRGSISATSESSAKPFKRGRGRCVRVTTKTGAFIDVYVGHLFVGWENNSLPSENKYLLAKPVWKQAGGLEPGDRIAVLSKLDCLEPTAQDLREVELVGYWIGDGSMPVAGSHQWGFYVDTKLEELKSRYVELVESYSGITAKLEIMQSGTTRIRATNSGRGRKVSTPLIDIIRRWGLCGSRAWDKRVPPEFFSLPDNQLALFISALWDTDGSIYNSSKGVPRLEYCTASEGLARDIQRLLFRFGVVSRLTSARKSYIYKGEKKEGRVSWRISINSDQYVKKLLSVMRLHGEKEVRRGIALEHVCSAPQQVLEGDIYWDTVKSVDDIGDHDYWDMNIPNMGSYVAGGAPLLSSNSGKRPYLSDGFFTYCLFVTVFEKPPNFFQYA